MQNKFNVSRNQAHTRRVAKVLTYLGSDTAVVTEEIIGTNYGWVKAYGGILWRAVTTESDLVLWPKQRVKVLSMANNLLVVEPIGPVLTVRVEPAAQPNPDWARQYRKVRAA